MGVRYLLDTHALIWLAGDGPRPRSEVAAAVSSLENDLVVSAASAFEIATKIRLGKLEEARPLQDRWDAALAEMGATSMDVADKHALWAGRLDWDHRDPFDRLLAAQAISEGLTLVTADRAFDDLPGLSVMRW